MSSVVEVRTHAWVRSIQRRKRNNGKGEAGNVFLVDCGERGIVQTNKVIYCTNVYCWHLLPEFKHVVTPVRNQFIALRLEKGVVPPPPWDFAMSARAGYVYFSQRNDGTILMGGLCEMMPDHQARMI